MEIIRSIILGVIQGLTEFLPVSSSGHLAILSDVIGAQGDVLSYSIFLHLGTLLSVVVVFRQDLLGMSLAPFSVLRGKKCIKDDKYFLWDVYLIIATIPLGVAGFFLKDRVGNLFSDLQFIYSMLFITGFMMIMTILVKDRGSPLKGWRAALIGCSQALAILPGLSRSGSTIFTGMLLGMNRNEAAKFSFILSIPAILGAVLLELNSFIKNPPTTDEMYLIIVGVVTAAISGYLAIRFLLHVVNKHGLPWFGCYCLSVSIVGFIYQISL